MTHPIQIHREFNQQFLDCVLNDLHDHKDEWATLPLLEKIKLLESMRKCLRDHAQEWVEATARGKNLDIHDKLVSEEWALGPYALAGGVNALIETMKGLEKGRKHLPGKNIYDVLLMNGISAEVWMKPDVTRENLKENTASIYKKDTKEGKVSLVLGAGNASSVCPLDVLYMLFAEKYVVVAKLNVVNDCMFPAMEKIFKPFIERGFVKFVCGDVDVGKYLTDHRLVDHIHMTGSAKTHDAILYGVGDDGKERKASNTPRIDKPITSELGGIGAVIVVPGPWNDADIQYQAEHIASLKLHNTGCNCVAAQIVVMPRSWEKSRALLEAVQKQFATIPERSKFYPGAEERLKEAVSNYKEKAHTVKGRALITDLDPKRKDQYAFHNEFFTTALGQTYLEGDDTKTYMENAVEFANNTLDGTLGIQLIIHPKTMKELGDEFENYIAKLQFGAIGVNAWNGVAYFIPYCSWGAYPGHTLNDIQSGIGVVHNAYLFDKPQKSVVYAPFWEAPRSLMHGSMTFFPKPLWFVTNKGGIPAMKKMTEFTLDPRITRIPMLFAAALRG